MKPFRTAFFAIACLLGLSSMAGVCHADESDELRLLRDELKLVKYLVRKKAGGFAAYAP